MGEEPAYSEYTLRQLHQIIRLHAYRLTSEQYMEIALEIERRESLKRPVPQYVQLPDVEPSLGFNIARASALFFYGVLLLIGFVWPIGYQIIAQPPLDMPVHFLPTTLAIPIFFFVGTGFWIMRYRLRYLPKLAVLQWAFVAATLSPFSAILYGFLVYAILTVTRYDSFVLLYLPCVLLGFYMPFILLSYWLKYKFRPDEF